MASNSATLLKTFFKQNGTASAIIRERYLMLNEGHRVIFINFNYNATTGKLKYAASIFRRDIIPHSEAAAIQFCSQTEQFFVPGLRHFGYDLDDKMVFYKDPINPTTPYYEITEEDVQNHMSTTDRRFEIRPVTMNIQIGLDYDDILSHIRWEMCHGAGCKGPRPRRRHQNRPGSADSHLSDASHLTTDSHQEMSAQLEQRYLSQSVRYYTRDRDIFISFKGLETTGEIAYGAAIRQRKPEDEGPPPPEVINQHIGTAEARLEENPVVFHLNEDQMEFSHQLKHTPPRIVRGVPANLRDVHREDITEIIVAHIFKRRGGKIQVRSY